MDDEKRMFFGAEVFAPWPHFPPGRMIAETERHLTLAFLGNTSFTALKDLLSQFPAPSFVVGPVGWCDRLLFIPEELPKVAALHVKWLQGDLAPLHAELQKWLSLADKRTFFPHVTVARSPFDKEAWRESFKEFPIAVRAIHLYESIGNLNYVPLWSYPLPLPFEELEHTADIAFLIRGETLAALFVHAQIALSFKFPEFLRYFSKVVPKSLDALITELNRGISLADQEIGCPFKAVSFHGEIVQKEGLLLWEMIVDV